ncbi:Bax inhibitor-1/YccA family protein [Actinomycetaceae bacterium TAE3-ERU4]|nr:Bax inhibitor-1/YccA family protein [Actinomycetaceae bacterium TAE3-ERU4]
MSNPVLEQITDKAVRSTPNGYPEMPGYTPMRSSKYAGGGQSAAGGQSYSTIPSMDSNVDFYNSQSVDGYPQMVDAQEDRITYDDVIVKTGFLAALTFGLGVISYLLVEPFPELSALLTGAGVIVGLISGLVCVFKSSPSPILIGVYATAQGLALGAISAASDVIAPGVVFQALIATGVVFGVTLALFKSGRVRNSSKVSRFAFIGVLGILALQLINLVLGFFNVTQSPWGLEGMTIMGIPVAGLLGVLVILIGGASLIGDFDLAKKAVEAGAPRKFSWTISFGILVTVIWLYINILRYLTILMDRR